jgi:1-acyl-sn-glycerol-3-phosphate acyltransferase
MSQNSQFGLLSERRFAPFFLTQFFGAGNDNVFKFALTVLATYNAAEWGGLDPRSAGAIIGGIFILPFVLFSATSGQLADKYEKSALIRFVKNFEIVVMLLVAAGFVWKIIWLPFAGVFLMGLHSTLFGPVKYAYLPQHLKNTELTGGNGLVETGTFVAILLGTMLGGVLVSIPETGAMYIAVTTLVLAVLGRVAAGYVPHSAAPDPDLVINWNPFAETRDNLRLARSNRAVFLSMLGISWLWFFGSIFLTSFSGFAKTVLGGDQAVVTLLLAVFSVGIGAGSLLCERLSGRMVEIGLVPFGAIGMTLFAADLFFATHNHDPGPQLIGIATLLAQPHHWRMLADLFLLAMFGGFYSVPLYALIQSRCEPHHRARIIAANNILNALFMVVASVMAAALLAAGLSLPQLFLVTALLNALVAAYIFSLVPEFLVRFLAWLLVHSVYRLDKRGLENIPDEGACVVICNHVSFADPVVLMGACPRPIRFVMDHRIFRVPLLNFIFRTSRAIPIAAAKEDAAMMERAFAEVAVALRNGEVVGIFPEGRITDTGALYPFRPGITRILAATPAPVVPMALAGLWGSFFSREGGAAMRNPLRLRPFRRIWLRADTAVPADQATPALLQQTVARLLSEAEPARGS